MIEVIMAYINATEEFLSDNNCMDALSRNGITIKNQAPTMWPDIWRIDVEGDVIPKTNKQIVIHIFDNGIVEIETV